MMIIRLSNALMARLKICSLTALPPAASPLCDWAAHEFTFDRARYILAINSSSLLPMVFPARGLVGGVAFLNCFASNLLQHHRNLELEDAFTRFIDPQLACMEFSKVGNPSTTGGLNDLIKNLRANMAVSDRGLAWHSLNLGRIPMKSIKFHSPNEAHRELCGLRLEP